MKIWQFATSARALVALFVLMVSLLSGCGGGGSSTSTPVTPAPAPAPALTPVPTPSVVPDLTVAERRSGGDATVESANVTAFGQSPESVRQDFSADANFKAGNAIFRNDHDGQGPLVNATTCQGCHTRDGRGVVPADETTPMDSMSIRLSTGQQSTGAVVPDPTYGTLLQVFGLASFSGSGVSAGLSRFNGGAVTAIGEGFGSVRYTEIGGQFADGIAWSLRKPEYRVAELSYGDFGAGIGFSPRVAPQLPGLGLLEAVPDSVLLENVDELDADSDGISGRENRALDPVTGEMHIGRFGAKATAPSLLGQLSEAYRQDMGVTNRYFVEEACTINQPSCIDAANAELDSFPGGVDIDDVELALVEFYVRRLAVPARRGFNKDTQTWDDSVVRGRTNFFEAQCGACHVQSLVTAEAAGSVLGRVELSALFPDAPPVEVLSQQTIYPYTDLLLHDMGGSCAAVTRESATGESCTAGDNCVWVQRCEGLADGVAVLEASGSEWRTPPLWGLGLVQVVNPNATFLHDGRARTISEAILWHDGEGAAARDDFLNMSAADRDDLLEFLGSL